MRKLYLFACAALFALEAEASNPSITPQLEAAQNHIPPLKSQALSRSGTATLSQNFEDGWDGTTRPWLPDGWTSVTQGEAQPNPWFTYYLYNFYTPNYEGYYGAEILYTKDYTDELLVSPSFQVGPGQELSFLAYFNPLYFFVIDNEHFDGNTNTFLSYAPAAWLEVLIKTADDDNWAVLRNFYDEFCGKEYAELTEVAQSFQRYTVDLGAYDGQEVSIAFRYVGTDGESMAIDDVRVDNAPLDAQYYYPYGKLFYGVNRQMQSANASIAVLPAEADLEWINVSDVWDLDDVEFEWIYYDENQAEVTSDQEDLTLRYSSEADGQLFPTPVLSVRSAGWADGEYSAYDSYQIGGRPLWNINGEMVNMGLAPFDPNEDGYSFWQGSDWEPIFGWNKDVDAYWTRYTFGDEAGANDYVKLVKIMNVYITEAATLTIEQAWAHAFIKELKSDAVFTLEVIPMVFDEDQWGYVLGEPLAQAQCKAADVVAAVDNSDYMTLPFVFDAPVSIDGNEVEQYVVTLSGFWGCAETFAPMQSWNYPTDGINHGWLMKEIAYDGDVRTSLSAMVNYTDVPQSFGIMLDACYGLSHGAVGDAIAECGDAHAEYYNMQGIRVDNPRKGAILIKRQGDSTSVVRF